MSKNTEQDNGMLAMLNQLLENQKRQDIVIQNLAQQVNSSAPGNVTMSQPMTKPIPKGTVGKVDAPEVQLASVSLEAYTDTRKPYICRWTPEKADDKFARDGVSRDMFENNPIRKTEWRGPIIVTTLTGNLPIGTIVESRDGFGMNYYAVSDKGLVAVDGYDKALQLFNTK